MTMQCDIITQERTVFSGQVDSVNLPGTEGRMGILPNHSPLLTSLDFGEVIVRTDGAEEYFAIGGGFAEVQPDHVTFWPNRPNRRTRLIWSGSNAPVEQAEQVMRDGVPEDPERLAQIRASLLRAQVQLDVGRRRRRREMPAGMGRPQSRENE